MQFPDAAQSKQIDQQEHNPSAGAKRVILRGQDPVTGSWVNIAASDSGDGTYTLKSNSLIDKAHDSIVFSNADGNGNYQTILFKLAAVTQRTLTLVYDANSKVTSIVRS